MTIDVALIIDKELVETIRYESPVNVPIPNIGDAVVNPQTDGLAVEVCRRIFKYSQDYIRITLDCA